MLRCVPIPHQIWSHHIDCVPSSCGGMIPITGVVLKPKAYRGVDSNLLGHHQVTQWSGIKRRTTCPLSFEFARSDPEDDPAH